MSLHIGRLRTRLRSAVPLPQESLAAWEAQVAALDGDALARQWLRDEEWLLIRRLPLALQWKAGGVAVDVGTSWQAGLSQAITTTLDQGQDPGTNLVRYPHRRAALADLFYRSALRDTRRQWAWQRMGLLPREGLSPDEALRAGTDTLAHEPQLIWPVLMQWVDSEAATGSLTLLLHALPASRWLPLLAACPRSAGYAALSARRLPWPGDADGGLAGDQGEGWGSAGAAGAHGAAAGVHRRDGQAAGSGWGSGSASAPGSSSRSGAGSGWESSSGQGSGQDDGHAHTDRHGAGRGHASGPDTTAHDTFALPPASSAAQALHAWMAARPLLARQHREVLAVLHAALAWPAAGLPADSLQRQWAAARAAMARLFPAAPPLASPPPRPPAQPLRPIHRQPAAQAASTSTAGPSPGFTDSDKPQAPPTHGTAPAHDAPAAPALLDTSTWHPTQWGGVLFWLARMGEYAQDSPVSLPLLLRETALALGAPADDPVVIAFCGGQRPDGEAPPGLQAQAAALVRSWSDWLDRAAPELPSPRLPHVCRRAGRLRLEPGWIELHLPMDAVDTGIRRLALDLDPGWLPWLGCVLRICYDDA